MLHRIDRNFYYIGDDFNEVLLKLIKILNEPELCLYGDRVLVEPKNKDMNGNHCKWFSSKFFSLDFSNSAILKIYISKGCIGEKSESGIKIDMSYLSDIDEKRYHLFLSKFIHLGFEEKDENKDW